MTCRELWITPNGACGALLIVLAVWLSSPASGIAAPQRQITVMVPASAGWMDTGVDVADGQAVEIFASGLWAASPEDSSFSGPNGFPTTFLSNAMVPKAPFGALVGRIGSETFAAGTSTVQSMVGRLYLAMNDIDGMLGDNRGYMVVQINITKAASTRVGCTSDRCALTTTPETVQ